MSGGSHNYLCLKDDSELFYYEVLNDMENMATRLIELGFEDASKETLSLKYTIEQSMVRAQVMKDRLEDVWKAVEWLDSSDWGFDSVEKAIEKYRGEAKDD